MAGVLVSFTVTEGAGTAAGNSVRTDANGRAAVQQWTLGSVPGPNVLTAAVERLPTISFSMMAQVGAAASIVPVAGDQQRDTTNALLPEAVRLRVRDPFGNPVQGAVVDFSVVEGGGSVTPSSATTDNDGHVEARWSLGPQAGSERLLARVQGAPLAEISVTATTVWPPVSGVSIASGYHHTCVVSALGRTYCWGRNEHGQLGDGTSNDRSIAVRIIGELQFVSVTAGARHTCALTTDGRAYCWGDNFGGQLGDNSTTRSASPVAVSGGRQFAELAAGALHTCGRTVAGEVYCWGSLIGASADLPPVPNQVSGDMLFASIATGERQTCGIDITGIAHCFAGTSTPTGVNGGPGSIWRPVPIETDIRFVGLTGRLSYQCGWTAQGAAYCWGNNDYGQLGIGSPEPSATPAAVAGGIAFGSVHGGYDFVCAIATTNGNYCWGNNVWGVHGTTSASPLRSSPQPMPLPDGLTFTSLSGGFQHMCGLSADGLAYCWGAGFYGQLGDGLTVTDIPFHHRAEPRVALRR